MDELEQIQAKFTQGLALVLQAWNALLIYQQPPATALTIMPGPIVRKPDAGTDET